MIKFLDCTLRDGGYINNWEFGYDEIKKYLSLIINSNVDYVELGFLVDKKTDINQTLFNCISEIKNYTFAVDKLVLMCAYLKFDIKNLKEYKNGFIKNIRYIFKPNEINDALKYADIIKQKGYNLFINPTFVNEYDLSGFKNLIKKVNKINPTCFTLVDSMGVLGLSKFSNLLNLLNDELNEKINLGIHLHNNLGFMNENIKYLKTFKTKRDIIIDATCKGLGRASGNPVLEEFIKIDENIFSLIKEPCIKFLNTKKENYTLSSLNNCHPCYATYLNRKNIKKEFINTIFQKIPSDFRINYDKKTIEKIVNEFLINK